MKEWLPLMGVVIAQFVIIGLYFVKQRVDDKRRWHERRLIVYSDLVVSQLQMQRLLVLKHPVHDEHSQDKASVNIQRDEMLALLFQVQLIASEEVANKAQALVDATHGVDDARGNAGDWVEAQRGCNRARRAFQDAVRTELHVKS